MQHDNVAGTFLAHSKNRDGKSHVLHEHLQSVGDIAAQFAAHMHPALTEAAKWTGLLHDLGKYRDAFQQYLRCERQGSVETHHAIYGAALAFQRKWLGPALAIAGHHAGLHNWATLQNDLRADTTYRTKEQLPALIERFENDVGAVVERVNEPEFIRNSRFSAEFYVRMLFSALVDADFLDTEAHYELAPRVTHRLQPDDLLQRLMAEKAAKPRDGELNMLRHRIFQQCLDTADHAPGFFSLTVPTGGGKTLASMAFALAHAQRHTLCRVIVVIPYLSIIEQNAAQYRRIFDPQGKGLVIEHHSAVAPPEDTHEARKRSPLAYATENWDAPIIITTSVQFIESLFANRTSPCRKLHNMARSVVIFDEVQTLPAHLLSPLLNVLRELRDHYGVSFVFSTATQPAFRHHPRHLEEGFRAGEVREITVDTAETFRQLQRVRYTLPRPDERLSWPELVQRLAAQQQVLCIVNVRRHAFELWEQLRRVVPDNEQESVFHLSSAMCAQHRFDLLGDDRQPQRGTIRYRLRHGQACRLLSTQLVEAGVDMDFPLVYRALGPLDAIVQAAGRCNREGRLTNDNGQLGLGDVVIFTPEEGSLPSGVYRKATDITATLLARTRAETLAHNHELFADYFEQLYQLTQTDRDAIQADRAELQYRDVAEKARVIKADTRSVIVLYGRAEEIVSEIRSRQIEKDQPRLTRDDVRRLQRYMVSLHAQQFQQLAALKQIKPLLPNLDLYVLSAGMYHQHLGLVLHQRPLEDLIV